MRLSTLGLGCVALLCLSHEHETDHNRVKYATRATAHQEHKSIVPPLDTIKKPSDSSTNPSIHHTTSKSIQHPTHSTHVSKPASTITTPTNYPTEPSKRSMNGTKSGIAVKDKVLYYNEEPFFIKGVAYSPVPLGDDPLYGHPYGDYFTNEFSAFWVRDMPLLKALGANSIRTYAWNRTRNHDEFLDMAHQYDLKVMITYFLGSTLQTPITSKDDLERVAQDFAKQVYKYKEHPAVLGWSFGNEINGGWNGFIYALDGIFQCGWDPLPTTQGGCTNFDFTNKTSPCVKSLTCLYKALYGWIDRAAYLAHEKLGPENYKLVTSTFADIDMLHLRLAMFGDRFMPNLDFYAGQIYRGKNFGEGEENFLHQVDDSSNKPLAITEYGVDAYRDSCGVCTKEVCHTPCYNTPGNETKGFGEDQRTHAEWVSNLASLLYDAHAESRGVLGGFVMAWIDEAWKTTTHFPTNICADNTKKGKKGGWKYHYPHAKFDPKTCDFKAHVECPNLNIWKPSLCGQYMPAFPDHYLNEGFFGINKVSGVDGTNVNQLEPRLLYAVLQAMWLPRVEPIIEWKSAASAVLMTAAAVTILITIWACQRHFHVRAGVSQRTASDVF